MRIAPGERRKWDCGTEEAGATSSITSGDDTLIAIEGETDVFAWTLADAGGTDTVLNFNAAEGDSLDLRDLLSNFEQGKDSLSDFISVTVNSTAEGSETVIQVSTDGKLGTGGDKFVDQTIVLDGVDLLGGNDVDAVIQSLLNPANNAVDQ